MSTQSKLTSINRLTQSQAATSSIDIGQLNIVDYPAEIVKTVINRSVGSNATFYTYVYPDEGSTYSSGLKLSVLKRDYKYIIAEATHSPGHVAITVPINLIEKIADIKTSSDTVPTAISSITTKLLTRMYASDGTTAAHLQLGFLLKATNANATDYYVYIYVRNNSSAARNITVRFIN